MSTDILATNEYVCNNPKQLFIDYFKLFNNLTQNNRLSFYITLNKDLFTSNFIRIFNTFSPDQQNTFITELYLVWVGTNNTSSGTSCNVKNIKNRKCDNALLKNTCITNLASDLAADLADGLWLRLGSFDTTLVQSCSKIDLTLLANNMGFTFESKLTESTNGSANGSAFTNFMRQFNNFITSSTYLNLNSTSNLSSYSTASSTASSTALSPSSSASSNSLNNTKIIIANHENFIRKFKNDNKCRYPAVTSGLASTSNSPSKTMFKCLNLLKFNDKQYFLIKPTVSVSVSGSGSGSGSVSVSVSGSGCTDSTVLCINKKTILFVVNKESITSLYYNKIKYSLNQEYTGEQKKDIAAINAIIKEIEDYTLPPKTSGGAKKNNKKKTKDTIVYKGKSRCVYTGPRGGKYIKYNNKYMSCKNV